MAHTQVWKWFIMMTLISTIYEVSAQGDDGNSTEGLRCYYCADTGVNNRCENFDTFKDAMDGTGDDKVKKTCEYPYNVTCAIETYQTVGGGTAAHIRDCSDGLQFAFKSFDLDGIKGVYDRLKALQHNNETSCVWDGNNLVCLTLCEGNFCNGPRLTEITNSSNCGTPSLFLMFLASLFLLRNHSHQ